MASSAAQARWNVVRLTPNTLCYGCSPELLRDCAQRLRFKESFSVREFGHALGASLVEAGTVLAMLVQDEFLNLTQKSGLVEHYQPLQKFKQLAVANITHGFSRVNADKLLAEVLENVRLINSDPEKYAFYRVNKIAVFGSYLGDAGVLGDLDIAYETGRDEAFFHQSVDWRLATDSGRLHHQLLLKLRCGKPRMISLHCLDEVEYLQTPLRMVFLHPEANQKRNDDAV